jgi:hypothetical protein
MKRFSLFAFRFSTLAVLCLCVSAVAFAADATSATALPKSGLNPQTIIAVAALVSAAVEVAKRLLKVQGRVSVIINLVAAVAAIYAVAPPESVLSLGFLVTAFQSIFTSAGIFATVSTVKGG